MKRKNVLLVIVSLFMLFCIKMPNVKAKSGLNEIGEKAQFCAYCNGNECYYTLKNKEEDANALEFDNDVSRIFYKKNKNSDIEEISLGGTFNYDLSYVGNNCEKYLYYVYYETTFLDIYYYVPLSEETLDSVSGNFAGTFVEKKKYDYRYSWGFDTFGDGSDIDNDVMTNSVKQIIYDKKDLENPSSNSGNSNNQGNSSSQSGQTDSTGYKCAVEHEDDLACGTLYFIPPQIPFLTNLIMNLIKIATPIVLIIKGLIDLFKAETSVTYIEISKTRAKFFKRLIPAIAVFLVVMLVQLIIGLIASGNENNTFLSCTDCFLNGTDHCDKTPQDKIDNYCKDMQGSPTIINGNGNTPTPTGVSKNNCQEVNVFNTITIEQAKAGLSNAISAETTSRGKAVAAANYLATNFPKLPYFWGGHGKQGINSKWGTCDTKTADVEGHSTRNTYQPYGMDCSGFVTWAMWQAGYQGEYKQANVWGSITSKKYEITNKNSSYAESLGAKVGDLVWHSGHIGIIIGKDSKGFIIAHEKGQAYGLTKEYLDDNISPKGKGFTYVILMDDFYSTF